MTHYIQQYRVCKLTKYCILPPPTHTIAITKTFKLFVQSPLHYHSLTSINDSITFVQSFNIPAIILS